MIQAHPLFPSAAPASYPSSVSRATNHPSLLPPRGPIRIAFPTDQHLVRVGIRTWPRRVLLFLLCIGLLPALAAVPLCIVGLMKLHKHREQAGHWLAIWAWSCQA